MAEAAERGLHLVAGRAEGRIYYCNQDGESFVVAAQPTYELLATNQLDDGCMASPAIYGKALYIRTKTHLYRVEQK